MDLQLAGRSVLVTGASKGIGLATVRALLDEGACVVAVSRSATPELDTLPSGRFCHVRADVTADATAERAVAAAVERFGGLDVLVNNAGGPPAGVTLPQFSFEAPSDAQWRAMFELNLFAAVRMIRAALPRLLERPGSAIVNVSTVNATQPGTMNADYAAAKAALNTLSQELSEELGPRGVRVNTVSPGPVRTAWWTEPGGAADVIASATGADRDAVLSDVAPEMMSLSIARLVEPAEVADMILLLASPRSAATTGANVLVDAGFSKAV